jgi:hypothetical protein
MCWDLMAFNKPNIQGTHLFSQWRCWR